jgi:hypothetical protein
MRAESGREPGISDGAGVAPARFSLPLRGAHLNGQALIPDVRCLCWIYPNSTEVLGIFKV